MANSQRYANYPPGAPSDPCRAGGVESHSISRGQRQMRRSRQVPDNKGRQLLAQGADERLATHPQPIEGAVPVEGSEPADPSELDPPTPSPSVEAMEAEICREILAIHI